MPSLIFTTGPLAGRRLELTAQLVLGRDEGADVVVDDPEISRRHAAMRPAGDTVEVEDLGSLNGTWVNGARIETRVLLTPGDVVQLGTSRLELAPVPASATETVAARAPASGSPAPAPAPAPSVAAPGGPAMPAFAPHPSPAAGGIATRRLTPTVLAFAVVIATAIALVVYFAAR
jgi:predicted component of type VI protein secretion system